MSVFTWKVTYYYTSRCPQPASSGSSISGAMGSQSSSSSSSSSSPLHAKATAGKLCIHAHEQTHAHVYTHTHTHKHTHTHMISSDRRNYSKQGTIQIVKTHLYGEKLHSFPPSIIHHVHYNHQIDSSKYKHKSNDQNSSSLYMHITTI